jgi:hypothetical protein
MIKSEQIAVELTFDEVYRAAMAGVERQISELKAGQPGSLDVKLTWDEFRRAASIGVTRAIHSAQNVGTEIDWDLHINAALGECMLAKGLGTDCPEAVGDR